jgi:ribosomal protein L11 methyltransferase
MGIDVDPEARRVARDNLDHNRLSDQVIISEALIEEVQGTFHLVIANIIDGVLLKIKSDLLRVLKPGGHLIVTGILEERETQFIDDFLKDTSLKIERRLSKDEWVGYWLKSTL